MRYPFNDPAGLDLADTYRRAQDTDGLIRVELPYGEPGWLVTRYADARFVLADKRFSRAMANERDSPRTTPMSPVGIVAMDPPEHTRLRTLVARAFTMRRAELLRPRVQELAERALAEMAEKDPPADLVEHFALTVPIEVICELLGVPAADRAMFRGWSEELLSTSGIEGMGAATGRLMAYMGELIELRGRQPADDLMTALIEARDEGDRLSRTELVQLCIAILVGGYETTASQLANFVYVLLLDGGLRSVTADTVESIVEELLRFVPMAASAAMPRYATEDLDIGGQAVRAGEPVLVAIGAANRDRLNYPDPDDLRYDRPARSHLAFGHGIHHCLGAPLARVELQESLLALTRLMPELRLGGDVSWKAAAFLRGPRTLPVTW